jgi:hypothetical protein
MTVAEYRNTDGSTTYVEKRNNTGMIVAGIVLVVLIVVGLLFATGFWSANVKGGALPTVSVKGGEAPDVSVKSKEVVVGTSKTQVDVPTVKTEKKTVDVPTVGVKDNGNK